MKRTLRHAGILLSILSFVICYWPNTQIAAQTNDLAQHYKVLPPITQDNLTIFPVVASVSFDTSKFLTLDDGIRSGQVIVTEAGQAPGLVRPRPAQDGVWRERPLPIPQSGARVNELAIINNADRPLLLIAGEIVTGGKQDRVVGKDRIIPPHGDPVALNVFCVEPHRWTGSSMQFKTPQALMAQPSVRSKALVHQNQEEVWNEVAKSRAALAAKVAAPDAVAIDATSSYAGAVANGAVQRQLESISVPIEHSYGNLMQQLHSEKAVGAVVAVRGELIWADVFASPSLLEKYWPKLVRSYAAEVFTPRGPVFVGKDYASQQSAQKFLDHFEANHENVETEPGIYRNTQLLGEDFDAFFLTSLLPNTGFNLHFAKMKH